MGRRPIKREHEQPFLSGEIYGLDPSVLIHRLANIACSEFTAGPNTRIDAFVTLTGKVKLGANCHIATGACIFGTHGFEAGYCVALSPGAKVFTATVDVDSDCLAYHAEATFEAKPITGPVKIGNYSCIGANSVILPGVTIGEQVQVGALSLVKRCIPFRGVYGGVPEHFLKDRRPLKYG